MKQWVMAALIAALVADLAIFGAVGFGLGALAITAPASTPGNGYNMTPTSVGTGYPVLTFEIPFVNVNDGTQLLTSILPNGDSTDIVFGTVIKYDLNGCGNFPGWPAWDNGEISGSIVQYYTISFSQDNINFFIDGKSQTTGFGNSYTFSDHFGVGYGGNDPYLTYCINGGWKAPGPSPVDNNTLYLVGIYTSPITVTVSLTTQGNFCMSPQGQPNPLDGACQAAENAGAGGGNLNYAVADEGMWSLTTTTTATYQSGYGSVKVLNPGDLAFNGGTISVSVSTGYGGFQACLLIPQPRQGGGSCDPQFPTQTIPNGQTAYLVTWSVPKNASQNSTIAGWNTWEVQLTNEYFRVGYSPATIDIAPQYAPGLPVVAFATNGTFYYPEVGDGVTLSIYANATNKSAAVTGISLWVYYQATGDNPTSEPACGAQWVTTNCPYATALAGSQLQLNGKNAVGTYPFTVDPTAGMTEITVLAESFTSTQQGSPIVAFTIQITPHGCTIGVPTCITKHGVSLWEMIGPLLISIALVLAGVILFFVVPVTWMRVLVVAVPVAGVLILYVFGIYTAWFAPGGAFNAGTQ